MPWPLPRAYTAALGSLAAAAAIVATSMRAPAATTTHLHRLGGLTVVTVCDPEAEAVVAEAWLGGGCAEGTRDLAHVAEHVAIASAGGGCDGKLTPDATIVRARGATLAAAVGPVWRAMTVVEADPVLVERECAAVAAEDGRPTRAVGWTARAVARHWQERWRAAAATLVVHGPVDATAVLAAVDRWPGHRRNRSVRWLGRRSAAQTILPGPAPTDRAAPAAAIAAAATGGAALLSSAFVIAAGADALRWPDDGDLEAWLAARAQARRLPIVGAVGPTGTLAAAVHVVGDPGWAARYRRAIDATTPAAIASAARALRGRLAARPPTVQARPALHPRATRTRRLAVAVRDDDRVALRWLWRGGPAAEGPGERGAAALAAAAITRCLEARVLDAVGGRAAVVVERDRIGLRAEFPAASWLDGMALVRACLADPDRSPAGHARDRDRLRALAHDLAHSAARRALAALARARYGDLALARDPADPPADGLSSDAVAAWWLKHHPLADAVVAARGPLSMAELAAALGPDAALSPDAAAAPPSPPLRGDDPGAGGELYLDGGPDDATVALGFDALGAGDPARAAQDVLAALLADPTGPLAEAMRGAAFTRIAIADTIERGYLALVFDHVRDRAATVAQVRRALTAVVARPPDAATVERVRARLIAADLAAADHRWRAVDALALGALVEQPERAAALAAVDAAAVARVATRILASSTATTVTVRPRDESPAVGVHRDARTRGRRRRHR